MIVAIDGPSGSGKGTVTKMIAKKMGLINIDTGAMYRCVGLAVLRNGLKISDEKEIVDLVDTLDIEFEYVECEIRVFLNGEDVTKEIRTPEVTTITSPVSAIIPVRLKMIELQRKMSIGKDIIMEGRDICTYVFPNADVKIYLSASEEERAERRYKELIEKGIDITYEETLKQIKVRDKADSTRAMGALKIDEEATVIDSTALSIEEVVKKIENIILSKK